MDFEIDEREYMEHHPYITMSDETEITYSDLKTDANGNEYITVYFETPSDTGWFKSMQLDYFGKGEKLSPTNIVRYSDAEVSRYISVLEEYIDLIYEDAREDAC